MCISLVLTPLPKTTIAPAPLLRTFLPTEMTLASHLSRSSWYSPVQRSNSRLVQQECITLHTVIADSGALHITIHLNSPHLNQTLFITRNILICLNLYMHAWNERCNFECTTNTYNRTTEENVYIHYIPIKRKEGKERGYE